MTGRATPGGPPRGFLLTHAISQLYCTVAATAVEAAAAKQTSDFSIGLILDYKNERKKNDRMVVGLLSLTPRKKD